MLRSVLSKIAAVMTSQPPSPAIFSPTPLARFIIIFGAVAAATWRMIAAIMTALNANLEGLIGYGFEVIFPLILISLILSMGPSKTREGILMRFATMCQLILVISVPPFSLHMLLGLPVVYLLVELLETRLPASVREPIEKWLVSC